MPSKERAAALFAAALLVGGVFTALSGVEDGALPAKTSEGDCYLLRPLDVISLWVYKQPDLSLDLKVAPDGHVLVPVVGRLKAAERSTTALAMDIRAGLDVKLKLVDPMVSVAVKEYAPQRV